jgi:hypothetical protein
MNHSEIRDHFGHTHQLEQFHHPADLPPALHKHLVDQLTPLTAAGFLRSQVTPELRQDVAQHVISSDRLVVAHINGQVSGFVASLLVPTPDSRLYHLEGIIIYPEFHGTGIALELLRRELAQTDADLLGFHTQSAKMKSLGQHLADFQSQLALDYGLLIGSRNQQEAVDIARYGDASLYGDQQQFSPLAIPDINWQRGDAQVLIGRIFKP